MSQAGQTIPVPAKPRVWHMYRAMVGVGLLCGLLIVSVYQLTKPRIDRNKAEALRRAIFHVLPEARSSTTFRLDTDGRFEILQGEGAGERLAHAGYDEAGRLIGFALEAEGMGYADVIRILYGYSFAQDAIVGIRVLETKETPGLGDKIETDPTFVANFEALDVSLDDQGTAPRHPIEVTKSGEKTEPWQIDGITGATISSVAIGDILRESSAVWMPRVERRIDDFREVPQT